MNGMANHEQRVSQMKYQILIDWERGAYALGWRGHFARKLLAPVLRQESEKLAARASETSTNNPPTVKNN